VNTSLLDPDDPSRLGTLIYLPWRQEDSVCVHMFVYYTFVVMPIVGVKTQ